MKDVKNQKMLNNLFQVEQFSKINKEKNCVLNEFKNILK